MASGRAWMRIASGCVVACAAFSAAPGAARGDGADPAKIAEWKAILDRWFAAGSKAFKDAPADFGSHPDLWDGTYSPGRTQIEEGAETLPPIPAEAVAPLAEHLFALAAKDQNQLEKKTPAWLFDEKRDRGLYVATPPKKGGGLLVVFAEGGEKGAAAKAHSAWTAAVPEGTGVLTTEVRMEQGVTWNEWSEEKFLVHALEAARRTWDFDTNRVWLAGRGEGGRAAWNFGGRNADLFAGIASISGGFTAEMNAGKSDAKGAARADYKGPLPAILGNLAHTAAYFSHAEDDAVRPVHADDLAAELLAKLQTLHPGQFAFRYDRTKTGAPAKGLKGAAAWLCEKRRDPYPKELTWETQRPSQRQFAWLCRHRAFIDWARYEARVTAPNRIEVRASVRPTPTRKDSGVPDVAILLSPKLIDFDKPLVIESGGRVLFEGMPPRTLWALLQSIGHRNDRNQWFEGHVFVQIPPEPWHDAWDAPH